MVSCEVVLDLFVRMAGHDHRRHYYHHHHHQLPGRLNHERGPHQGQAFGTFGSPLDRRERAEVVTYTYNPTRASPSLFKRGECKESSSRSPRWETL